MNKKEIIGIVGGMGPHTGLDLAGKIFNQTDTKNNREHLSIALFSFPSLFSDRTSFLLDQTKTNPAFAITEVIQKLEEAGAAIIGIPCNTAHAAPIFDVVLKELKKIRCRAPVVHMIKETGFFINKNYPHIRKVGLLATKGTYAINLYPDFLKSCNIEVVSMDEAMQDTVHDIIYNPANGIKAGLDHAAHIAKERLFNVIDELQGKGAEAVILGCTEIPLVIKERMLGKTVLIDPALILARSLINEISPNKLKPY